MSLKQRQEELKKLMAGARSVKDGDKAAKQLEAAKRRRQAQQAAEEKVQSEINFLLGAPAEKPKEEEAKGEGDAGEGRVLTAARRRQYAIRRCLIRQNFYDNEDEVSIGSSDEEELDMALAMLKHADMDSGFTVTEETVAATTNKELPKGFFDDEKEEAAVRGELKKRNDKMTAEMVRLQKELAEEEEKQREGVDVTEEEWNMSRARSDLQHVVSTLDRLDAIKKKHDDFIKLHREDLKKKKEQMEADEDSSSSDEMLGLENWRTKSVKGKRRGKR